MQKYYYGISINMIFLQFVAPKKPGSANTHATWDENSVVYFTNVWGSDGENQLFIEREIQMKK